MEGWVWLGADQAAQTPPPGLKPACLMFCCLVNGQVCSTVDCQDRGLAYGDGVFTSVAVQNKQACLWRLHHRRLQRDCEKLKIAFGAWSKLQREVLSLAAGANTATMKVIITRGKGKRGYRPPPSSETGPTRIVMIHSQKPALFSEQAPAHLTLCRHRLPHTPALAGVKHLNRLDQILARSEWQDEYQEGLMLDDQGAVVEGTMSNIFIWHDGVLLTPPIDHCGVAGVMREYILERAITHNVPCAQKKLCPDDFDAAEGAFLCNAVAGIRMIGQIDGRALPINKNLVSFTDKLIRDLWVECTNDAQRPVPKSV